MKKKLFSLLATLLLGAPMLASAVPVSFGLELVDNSANVFSGSFTVDSADIANLPATGVSSAPLLALSIDINGILFDEILGSGAAVATNGQASGIDDICCTNVGTAASQNLVLTIDSCFQFTCAWLVKDFSNDAVIIAGNLHRVSPPLAVTEPASFALMGLGLMALALIRSRVRLRWLLLAPLLLGAPMMASAVPVPFEIHLVDDTGNSHNGVFTVDSASVDVISPDGITLMTLGSLAIDIDGIFFDILASPAPLTIALDGQVVGIGADLFASASPGFALHFDLSRFLPNGWFVTNPAGDRIVTGGAYTVNPAVVAVAEPTTFALIAGALIVLGLIQTARVRRKRVSWGSSARGLSAAA